ncbi:MAG TPA: ABC transporter permease [Gemmatimonadaceae bacterium]
MSLVQASRAQLRSLRRAPRFAATVVAILALGIGLSTAVFTVADALVLRKLPVRDQNRIVVLAGEARGRTVDQWPLTLADTRDFARRTRALQSVGYVAYEGAWPVAIRNGDADFRLRRALVSGNYFSVLGTTPVLGRSLRPEDDIVGAAPVAVISYDTWQRLFGNDPAAIGRSLVAEEFGLTYRIIGVMPQGLAYPSGTDFWAPFVPGRLSSENDTSAYTALDIVGRLAPTATAAGAANELTRYFAREGAPADERALRGRAHILPRVILGDARPAVFAFAAAAAVLLVIACINVANLLLVRGLSRTREIAVRIALGASRSRVVGQLIGENIILAIAGGVAGAGVAALAVRGFLAFAPANIPLLGRVRLDLPALAAALGITMAATVLFGLAPALLSTRDDAHALLRSGTRHSAGRAARRTRELLVVAQVALAVLMLSAAALVGRSLVNLQDARLGFDASHMLVAELAIRYDQYSSSERQAQLVRDLVTQLGATPGVQGVSPVVAKPFSGTGGWTGHARTEGQSTDEAATNPLFDMEVVAPGYFATFGVPVLRGRALTDADREGAERVVVVSQSAARAYWAGRDPIGERLLMGSTPNDEFTVVGVVADTRYRDLRDALPSVYFPIAQNSLAFTPTTLVIRSAGDPTALVPTVRRVIDRTAPGVRLASAAAFADYMREPLAQPRLNTFLLVMFGGAAVVLAGIGLFGVMSTMVRQRAHEIGVRMALGATAGAIQRMVLGRGLAIAGIGVTAGIVIALWVNRALSAMLYGVQATDLATLIGVAAALGAIATLATFGPARAGAHVDPMTALRADG